MDLSTAPPRAVFELRHSLNPPTLTVPADADHPEFTIRATGHPLTWHVATVDGIVIELHQYLFNWRVTLAYQNTPMLLEGGWCYFGLTWESFCSAVRGASEFDPHTQDAPANFSKDVLGWTAPMRRPL
ncbi:hypothetical protein ACWFMI_23830 [Nocardiopsis terrae]|uniref:hypothetical protein n=1 Tax=Streptomyces sp. NPDC057554 TaxID=3350538 RepID=UPI003675461B